jgi:hypothetical protein
MKLVIMLELTEGMTGEGVMLHSTTSLTRCSLQIVGLVGESKLCPLAKHCHVWMGSQPYESFYICSFFTSVGSIKLFNSK